MEEKIKLSRRQLVSLKNFVVFYTNFKSFEETDIKDYDIYLKLVAKERN